MQCPVEMSNTITHSNTITVPDDLTLAEVIKYMSPYQSCHPDQIKRGMKILALHRTDNRYHPGHISTINSTTYSVDFIGLGNEEKTQEATELHDLRYFKPRQKKEFAEKMATHTTILLRNAMHPLRNRMIHVHTPFTIHGESEKKTIIQGGFYIENAYEGEQKEMNHDNNRVVRVDRVTIRGSCNSGIVGFHGMAIPLNECSITSCQESGVVAMSTNIFCHNVRISKCGCSGIRAQMGGVVVLNGLQQPEKGQWHCMRVFENVQDQSETNDTHYGLDAGYSNGQIILVKPLKKEYISVNNGRGNHLNWGGETIKCVAIEDLDCKL